MSLVKKICFVVDPHQSKNRIFDYSESNPVNRDDGVYPFYLLKKKLTEHQIEISTQDILKSENADLLLFLDVPKDFKKYANHPRKYLIITESELIKPQNWNLEYHKHFQKIFTWNDDFVDNKKYFKLNFSNKIYSTEPEANLRNKFCCLIAGAKKNNHPFELYSKRIDTIRWFEKNAPNDFDLFGSGWDQYEFTGPVFIRALNKFKFLRKYFAPKYTSYRGRVDSKKTTLSEYQFSICYENAQNISGYITEKIFDSMFAGCIPVYWGAPNVLNFIPENCFIDRQKFKDDSDMYNFLKSMSLKDVQIYQKNVFSFINSDAMLPYSAANFSNQLVNEISAIPNRGQLC